MRSRYQNQGYWRQPQHTTEKLRPDTAGSSARIYQNGDEGYHQPDGGLVCLGRADDHVKVAGHRVELVEIEQALLAHDQVDETAVVAHPAATGDPLLVAYFVTGGRQVPTATELRRFLASQLAAPVIPARFIHLDQMPLTRSGKVDRRSLPVPDQSRPQLESAYVGPRNPAEELVARIWKEVLELDQVGVHDNFFDLGGHSLLATRIISRLRDALGVEVSYQVMFNSPTVAGVVSALAGQQPARSDRRQSETPSA